MTNNLHVVDVFGRMPGRGNALAVVVDDGSRSAASGLELARFFGFAETTVVSPSTTDDADYHVRIFTPDGELPFAGHPTLGTAAVWRRLGGAQRHPDRVVQSCGVGLVEVPVVGDTVAFVAPPLLRSGPLDAGEEAEVLAELGLTRSDVVDVAAIDNGPGWVGVLLHDADAVLHLEVPSTERFVGVAGCWPTGSESALEVRAFLPSRGTTVEDPVTGSLQASFAQWLTSTGVLTAPYLATQGRAAGHDGLVRIGATSTGAITVGGAVHHLASGSVPT